MKEIYAEVEKTGRWQYTVWVFDRHGRLHHGGNSYNRDRAIRKAQRALVRLVAYNIGEKFNVYPAIGESE